MKYIYCKEYADAEGRGRYYQFDEKRAELIGHAAFFWGVPPDTQRMGSTRLWRTVNGQYLLEEHTEADEVRTEWTIIFHGDDAAQILARMDTESKTAQELLKLLPEA